MAELKRNFLDGKMNKDADERLVPDGQYRDALNIEISTSENNNKGVIQTLNGNVELPPMTTTAATTISADATTVGSVVDQSNGLVYNFVCNASSLAGGVGVISDAIVELKPKNDYSNAAATNLEFTPVFTDVYESRYTPVAFSTPLVTGLPTTEVFVGSGTGVSNVTDGVYPGMRVRFITSSGEDLWAGADVKVKAQAQNGDVILTPIPLAYNPANGKLVFTKERILNFRSGTSELESNVGDGTGSSKTPNGSIITGINLASGFILFSDGRNEPKKINIERSKLGTSSLKKHSFLYIKQDEKLIPSGVIDGVGRKDLVELSHVTVIRPNPNRALTVETSQNNSSTGPETIIALGNQDSQASYGLFKMATSANVPWQPGEQVFYIQTQTNTNYALNSTIKLVGGTSLVTATAIVNEVYSNNKYRMIFQSIDGSYVGDESPELWTTSNVKTNTFYGETFVYFAYRYVYTDGELSCISPYSEAAFIPDTYSYSPKDGFNLGMQNIADQIVLKDFISTDMPKDVVEVELLLRTTDNENIYLFRSIKRGSTEFNAVGTGNNKGLINITQEQAGSTLPSSQALRSFDAIPKTALAQEFTAGRLIYGNYTQDYDLLDDNGQFITAKIDINSESIENAFTTSVTSSNNYQVARTTGGLDSDLEGSGNNALGFINFSTDNWRQMSRQIATTASSTYSDDTNYRWASKRGIYSGTDSITQTGSAFNLSGSGTTIDPYEYFYTAPTTGTYTWAMNVQAIYEGISFSSDVGGPENSTFNWRLAIYECDANGEMLNIDGTTYATAPTPVWFSDPTNGIDQTTFNNSPNIPQNFVFDPLVVTAEVELVATKKYQVFIVVNRKPLGLAGNGTITSFVTTGLTDEVNLTPSDNQTQGMCLKLYKAVIGITSSPDTTNTLPSLRGERSVKSQRPYQIGVVYRDRYGRESSVLVDEKNNFSTPKELAPNKNVLNAVIQNNAPQWAESYKFFIKETTEKYYNLVMDTALANNDGIFAWLVFNSADVNKVKVGDYLIQKKAHGTSSPVTSIDAKWKVIDVENEGTLSTAEDGTSELSVGGTVISDAVINTAANLIGKFFVKVNLDSNFTTYIGTIAAIDALGSSNANGAVFETESKQNLDLDLYYEVGPSYPIRLTRTSAEQYIPVGSKVSIVQIWASNTMGDTFDNLSSFENQALIVANSNLVNSKVTSVSGATTFPTTITDFYDITALCTVNITNLATYNTTVADLLGDYGIEDVTDLDTGWVIAFERPDGSSVTAQAIGSIVNGVIKVKPYTHPTSIDPVVKSQIQLPWYNCIAFGNGVESDTIRDDFNAPELLKYVATGKQSGFKANLPAQQYKETREENQLIYSQIFNEDAGVNKLNQFLAAENIVKKINPENGSVQKLFSRDTNLIIFCESKVFGGPVNKDIIFNADGNGQLITSNKVIGTLTPYSGDYGISTNPESFASDEFRIYFTDKDQGAVLRLSRDGITPIHEYGMVDWFNDNLKSAQALVGSFDDKKGEYNLTVHNVTNPGWKKEVYTLSFDEAAKGWVCFKSFIPEQGFSLNNQFFTFKNGDLYLHHYAEVNRNQFYGVDNNSSVTSIFNDAAGTVKSFNALSYEGTQAQIITDDGDGEYFNEFNNSTVSGVNLTERGWYAEYVNTDQQEGQVDIFVEKEGKWFNYIKGIATNYTNANDGVQTANNLDTHEFSVQGIGQLSNDATLVSGVAPTDAYSLTFNNNTYAGFVGDFTTTGINLYGITALSGATANTFVITPAPGFVLDAVNFSNATSSSFYSAVTFTNSGVANSASNTVVATITWTNQAISADGVATFQIQTSTANANSLNWVSKLELVSTFYWDAASEQSTISFQGGVATPAFLSAGQIAQQGDSYSLTANLQPNVQTELVKFRLSANPGYAFNPSQLPYIGFLTNPNEYQAIQTTSETFIHTNVAGQIDYVDITVSVFAAEEIELSDGFAIYANIGQTEVLGANWLTNEITIDDAALSTIVVFDNNDALIPTATIEAGETWVTSVTVNPVPVNALYSSVTVVTTANAGSAREADLKLYAGSDTGQTTPSTLVFKQNALDAIQIYRANFNNGLIISDTTYNVSAAPHIIKLMVATNGIAPVTGDFTFNYTVGATGWLSFDSVEEAPGDLQTSPEGSTTNYWVRFNRTLNNVGTTRTAIITATHPDNVVTDTITINQLGAYDPATDTITFCDVSGNPITNFAVPSTAATTTGYLISAPLVSGVNPLVYVDDATGTVFDEQGSAENLYPVIGDVTYVAGQPYTHTYTISFGDNAGFGDYTGIIHGYYAGGSYYASNQTSNPDDTVTATQPGSPYAYWARYNMAAPAPGQAPMSPPNAIANDGQLWGGWLYVFNAIGVSQTDAVDYTAQDFEVGIYASVGVTYKYIEYTPSDVPTDWSTATEFSASLKPTWMTNVVINNATGGVGGQVDGRLRFRIADNGTGDFREVIIGIYTSASATSPASVLRLLQTTVGA